VKGAIVVGIALIGMWYVAADAGMLPPYMLPHPAIVAAKFAADPVRYGNDFLVTFYESIGGLFIAIAVSACVAVMLFAVPSMERGVVPILVAFKAIPLIAIAPLLTLWFGAGLTAKSIMAATICFFPILSGFLRGFRNVSNDEREFLRNLGLGIVEEVRFFRVYKALPYIFGGIKVASVLAVVGAIVAEYVGANAGLGTVVLSSSLRLDTPTLFVGMILSGACGVALYAIAMMLETLVLRKLRVPVLGDF
jgi:NitT/TauT family transport system permease protein